MGHVSEDELTEEEVRELLADFLRQDFFSVKVGPDGKWILVPIGAAPMPNTYVKC